MCQAKPRQASSPCGCGCLVNDFRNTGPKSGTIRSLANFTHCGRSWSPCAAGPGQNFHLIWCMMQRKMWQYIISQILNMGYMHASLKWPLMLLSRVKNVVDSIPASSIFKECLTSFQLQRSQFSFWESSRDTSTANLWESAFVCTSIYLNNSDGVQHKGMDCQPCS